MRVHSNVLTENDILTAALQTGVIVHRLEAHGSMSRARAFTFYLEGNGAYGGQWGHHAEKSATWDEWGAVIGLLYTKDPQAHYGAGSYESVEHFNWATGNRFVGKKMPLDTHYRHKWQHEGLNVTGKYTVAHCMKCTALWRQLMPKRTFSELE